MSVNKTVARMRSMSNDDMLTTAGQELLDITQERFDVAGPEDVIISGIFDEFCAGYLPDKIATCPDWNLEVSTAMKDHRRDLNGGQNWPDVDLSVQ